MNTIKIDGGTLRYSVECGELIIEHVEANNKRMGIGTKLIQLVKREAIKQGLPIALCAYPVNADIDLIQLVGFYKSNGFTETFSDGLLSLMEWRH